MMVQQSPTDNAPWVVHMSTYLPYEDGMSTFTWDLVQAQKSLFEPELQMAVAAVDVFGIDRSAYPKEVRWTIDSNKRSDYKRLAQDLNDNSNVQCIILQHEYGIFGGHWGSYLLDFLENLKKPITIVLHTVMSDPPSEAKELTQRILDASSSVVVLTRHAHENLHRLYHLKAPVAIIPHGIHPVVFTTSEEAKATAGIFNKTILGTFGFLSPSKGIEYVLEALPAVIKEYPNVEYWLMGRTHPLVQARDGEAYRESLIALAKKLHIEDHVKIPNKYMALPDLLKFLSFTDIYISTSLNPDHTVSGTFSYALGSGRAVVSTSFIQAKEYIEPGMGVLVDFRNPQAYSDAILTLLSSPERQATMEQKAYEHTRHMLWTNVALSFLRTVAVLCPNFIKYERPFPPINLDHVKKMTDTFGLLQFSRFKIPDPPSGYTLDDNARALIASIEYRKASGDPAALPLIETYLRFIGFCQTQSGAFLNYMQNDQKTPSLQNEQEDLDDTNGRAIWALGVTAADLSLPPAIGNEAKRLWDRWMAGKKQLHHIRAHAFFIKGLVALFETNAFAELSTHELDAEALKLVAAYGETNSRMWQWFEPHITYANAVLPDALLQAYRITKTKQYLDIGLTSLEFLIQKTFMRGVYVPIGQNGWLVRDRLRAHFDQQPEDPAAMIGALITAYTITNKRRYRYFAMQAFWWFLGNNILGEPVYDRTTGGCQDGLTKTGVNQNEGAESTVSYLLARLSIADFIKAGHI